MLDPVTRYDPWVMGHGGHILYWLYVGHMTQQCVMRGLYMGQPWYTHGSYVEVYRLIGINQYRPIIDQLADDRY